MSIMGRSNDHALLPCPECGHDLFDYDFTKDGIGTDVQTYKRGRRGKRIYAEVPGFECPECGNQGVI